MAIASANTKMHGIAHRKILTSSQNACTRSGNVSRKTGPLKNDRRTRSHPGAIGTSTTTAATTIAVLVAAMAAERRSLAARVCLATGGPPVRGDVVHSSVSRRDLASAGLDDRRHTLRDEPLVRDALQLTGTRQRGECGVGAVDERVVLLEHQPEIVGGAARLGGELTDDTAALDLDGGDEQRGRQVDDDGVDLVGLEGGFGSALSSYTNGSASGWMTSAMKSRLVVPTWAPNFTSFRSATVVAPSAGEPARPTIAWLLE